MYAKAARPLTNAVRGLCLGTVPRPDVLLRYAFVGEVQFLGPVDDLACRIKARESGSSSARRRRGIVVRANGRAYEITGASFTHLWGSTGTLAGGSTPLGVTTATGSPAGAVVRVHCPANSVRGARWHGQKGAPWQASKTQQG